jgi:O-antigen ligase
LVALGALLALLRWPMLGLGLLILAAVLFPFGIGTGTQTTINLAIILVAAFSLHMIVDKLIMHDLRFLPSRTLRPLAALIVVSLISFVNGVQPWMVFAELAPLRAQMGGLVIFIMSACAFVLFAHRVRDVRMLSRLTWIFLGLAGICTIERAYVPFSPLRLLDLDVANGSMFWLWMVILAFSQGVFNRTLAPMWRAALLGLVGCYLLFAMTQNRDWTSGWAPELIAIGAILWVGSARAGLAGIAVAGAALVPKATAIADALLYHNDKNQYDLLTRTAAWQIMGELIKLNPILGIGFANYYHYTPLFPILGYAVKFNSHNNYIDILAQTGVLGLICFGWFFWELFRAAWDLRQRVAPGFGQAYVYGIIGAIPAMLLAAFLGDWVLPFVYNIGLAGFRASVLAWLFMGGLLVVEHQTARAESHADRS